MREFENFHNPARVQYFHQIGSKLRVQPAAELPRDISFSPARKHPEQAETRSSFAWMHSAGQAAPQNLPVATSAVFTA